MAEGERRGGSISRKDFLRLIKLLGLTGALQACGLSLNGGKKRATARPEMSQGKKLEIKLGAEESVAIPGVHWVPDGHTSMLRMPDGQVRVWLSGGPRTFMLKGESLGNLDFQNPEFVFGPAEKPTRDGFEHYASIHSIIPGVSPGDLFGFFHRELSQNQKDHFPFTASIGLAVSKDGGLTWERQEKMIMEGYQPKKPPENGASGAGQPAAFVEDNQAYLFFIDWTKMPNSIHLARARIDSVHKPQAWQRWTGENWGRFGNEKESEAVLSPPAEWKNSLYTALPGVSYNHHLGKYLMIFECNLGFGMATSENLTRWERPQLMMLFSQPQFPIEAGNTWFSYPTLLSETSSDRETNKTGWLIYSQGIREGPSHSFYRRPFEMS